MRRRSFCDELCQLCDVIYEITLNNIKKHEDKCREQQKEPVKYKIDFSGKDKQFVVKLLQELGAQQICIAKEKGMSVFTHVHAYYKTNHYWNFENLQRVIKSELEKQQPQRTYLMNLEKCKSGKAWIKYITKEDEEPYFENIDMDFCHDNYLMMKYIRENQVINPFDYGVKHYQTEFKRKRL